MRPRGLTYSPQGFTFSAVAPVKASPMFRSWLAEALEGSGQSKREIARRMAAKHPRGVTHDTIETARRTLNKILSGDLTPTQPTRATIAAALERDDFPSVEDDEEPSAMPLTRDEFTLLGDLMGRLGATIQRVDA